MLEKDTQKQKHAEAVDALIQDLDKQRNFECVMILTFSEFGRRAKMRVEELIMARLTTFSF
jgi:hypothetical protein